MPNEGATVLELALMVIARGKAPLMSPTTSLRDLALALILFRHG